MTDTTPKPKRRRWLMRVVIVLAVLLAGWWFLFRTTPDPRLVGHWGVVESPDQRTSNLYDFTEFRLSADGGGSERWASYPGDVPLNWGIRFGLLRIWNKFDLDELHVQAASWAERMEYLYAIFTGDGEELTNTREFKLTFLTADLVKAEIINSAEPVDGFSEFYLRRLPE